MSTDLRTTCSRGSCPDNGEGNGYNGRGDEDSSEVVGPGQVEVDSPAEETEGDGHEGAEDDAPVLVVEEVLLVRFVVLVNGALIVGLNKTFVFGSSKVVLLAALAAVGTWARANLSIGVIGISCLCWPSTNDAMTRLQVLAEWLDIGLKKVKQSKPKNDQE